MASVKDLFGKFSGKEKEEDYYEELPATIQKEDDKFHVRFFRIKEEGDIKEVIDLLRDGNNIAIIDRKSIIDNDKFKRILEKLKKTCNAVDGDIAALSPNMFIATSSDIRVERRNI